VVNQTATPKVHQMKINSNSEPEMTYTSSRWSDSQSYCV